MPNLPEPTSYQLQANSSELPATSYKLIASTGTRPADMVQFEETMAAFFMQAADLLGVPKSIALIYGVVFASPEPLCFADVEERLDISKGSISQGLRVLKEMGAIKTVAKKAISSELLAVSSKPQKSDSEATSYKLKATSYINDRREYFEPDLELRKMIQRFLDQKVNRQLELGSQKLTQLRDKLPKNNIHHTKILDERVSQLENWHTKTKSLMPVIKTFLTLTGKSF